MCIYVVNLYLIQGKALKLAAKCILKFCTFEMCNGNKLDSKSQSQSESKSLGSLTFESSCQLSAEEDVGQFALPVALQWTVAPPAEKQVVEVDAT